MSIANAAITATLLWLLTALLSLLTALLVGVAPLGERGKRQHQRHCKESDACFHAIEFPFADQSCCRIC
jgi:hypothetical protein